MNNCGSSYSAEDKHFQELMSRLQEYQGKSPDSLCVSNPYYLLIVIFLFFLNG